MKNLDLQVSCNEVVEGRNYAEVLDISKNEKVANLFNFHFKLSNGAEETFGVFNDANRSYGLIRKFLGATIYEENSKSYNLGDTVGMEVIIVIEKALSKNGNEYWKICDFEKITEDTDLDEFEFVDGWDASNDETSSIEEIEDIEDLEDMLDAE